jgi:hypothetical protein
MTSNMKKKILILILILLVALIILSNLLGHGWIVYYERPFTGKVINSETKEPIEGAIVVAIYKIIGYLMPVFVFDAKEVLTNKNGEFYIPPHMSLSLWPFSRCDPTEFIFYKPGYESDIGYLRGAGRLTIFAIGPSNIGYLEEHTEGPRGHQYQVGTPKTKIYPEGLIFIGEGCKEKMDSLKQSTPFMIDYIFFALEGAREKIKRLAIPLDCPQNGEPVPNVDTTYNFRNDIQKHLDNSFVVVELSELKTLEERVRNIPGLPYNMRPKDLPLSYRTMNEEQKQIELNKMRKQGI